MRNARAAEWLLRRTITQEQAAAEVGDLLELRPVKGGIWFWLAILQLLVRQSWRHVLAFVAALYSCGWGLEAVSMRLHGIHSPHRLDNDFWWSQPAGGALSLVAVTSVMMFFFAAIRFGIADRMTRTAAVLATSAWAIVFFWWQPVILFVSFTCPLVLTLPVVRSRNWRSILLATPLLVLTFFCLFISSAFIASVYQNYVAGPPVGTAELQAHPSIKVVIFALYIAVTFSFTWACTFVHRKLAPTRTQKAIEDTGDLPPSIL